jgi:hypothetical protein
MLKQRINEYDIIKGLCVIIMIMHHCYDYFDLYSPNKIYLRFVTGAFVFFAGFMITNIYFRDSIINFEKISKRLIQRGFRLILLFIIFNSFIFILLKNGLLSLNFSNTDYLLKNIAIIFFIGKSKIVAFEILLPIAYVFIITGIIIKFFKEKYWIIFPISIILFILCSFFYFSQASGYNIRYLTIGLLGVSIGFISLDKLLFFKKYTIYFIVFYILYLFAITYLKIYFPLYFLTVVINILLFYIISININTKNIFTKNIMLLGEYSLISYIFQIFFLQIYSKLFKQDFFIVLDFLITLIITLLFIQTLDYLKRKYIIFNKTYKIFF